MSGYDNPQTICYRFPAAAIASAATMGIFTGPSGKKGRVTDLAYVVTTGVTVAAAAITVGITGDTDKFFTQSVPVASANAVGNGGTYVAEVDADTAVLVTSDGGCTAGAADLLVTVDWY
ncbi:MAG: hypothetical protein ACU85E_16900 [Gammaproteobacteria bacterium]